MIKLSFLNLFRRKTRTILCLIGIIIGVLAMIGMISVVDGLFGEFNQLLSSMQGVTIIEKDAADEVFSFIPVSYEQKLENIRGVRVAVPEIWGLANTIDGKKVSVVSSGVSMSPPMIYGTDMQKYLQQTGKGLISINVEKGTNLSPSDKGKVLVGGQLAEDHSKFVGSTIKINNKSFRVKGILKKESSTLASLIVMNLEDSREVLSISSDKVNTYHLDLSDPSEDQKTAEIINFKYGTEIEARTSADYSAQMSEILGSFRLSVFVIAGISAIVAGIGIVNTMLMSVLERYREIGALRAIGWTSNNIMSMILLEAMFLGVLGGILGIIFGFIAAQALHLFIGLPVLVSPVLIIETFIFALCIGLFAGVYPAFRASRLQPIEALRR